LTLDHSCRHRREFCKDFECLVDIRRIDVEVGHPALPDAPIDKRCAATSHPLALEMGCESGGDRSVDGYKDHIGLGGFDGQSVGQCAGSNRQGFKSFFQTFCVAVIEGQTLEVMG
jgi:hypothetical protein